MNMQDSLSDYILTLQEHGLEVNELALSQKEVPIETYATLLNNLINMTTQYRDELIRNSTYRTRMSKLLGLEVKLNN